MNPKTLINPVIACMHRFAASIFMTEPPTKSTHSIDKGGRDSQRALLHSTIGLLCASPNYSLVRSVVVGPLATWGYPLLWTTAALDFESSIISLTINCRESSAGQLYLAVSSLDLGALCTSCFATTWSPAQASIFAHGDASVPGAPRVDFYLVSLSVLGLLYFWLQSCRMRTFRSIVRALYLKELPLHNSLHINYIFFSRALLRDLLFRFSASRVFQSISMLVLSLLDDSSLDLRAFRRFSRAFLASFSNLSTTFGVIGSLGGDLIAFIDASWSSR